MGSMHVFGIIYLILGLVNVIDSMQSDKINIDDVENALEEILPGIDHGSFKNSKGYKDCVSSESTWRKVSMKIFPNKTDKRVILKYAVRCKEAYRDKYIKKRKRSTSQTQRPVTKKSGREIKKCNIELKQDEFDRTDNDDNNITADAKIEIPKSSNINTNNPVAEKFSTGVFSERNSHTKRPSRSRVKVTELSEDSSNCMEHPFYAENYESFSENGEAGNDETLAAKADIQRSEYTAINTDKLQSKTFCTSNSPEENSITKRQNYERVEIADLYHNTANLKEPTFHQRAKCYESTSEGEDVGNNDTHETSTTQNIDLREMGFSPTPSDKDSTGIGINLNDAREYSNKEKPQKDDTEYVKIKRNVRKKVGVKITPKDFSIKGQSFTVPKEFWEKYWVSDRRALKSRWTDDFVDCLKTKDEYKGCSFRVHYHRCYRPKTKSRYHFYVILECENTKCTFFLCGVRETITQPYCDMEVEVFQEKKISHDGNQVYRRRISGEKRTIFAKKAKKRAPCMIAAKEFEKLHPIAKKSGNRDGAPSGQLIQKMSSEHRLKKELHPHPLVGLHELKKRYREDEKWEGEIISGFMHGAFREEMWSEKHILYLISLAQKQPVFAYFDATGSVIRKIDGKSRDLLYYALILPGSYEYSPLPIAHYITDKHTIPSIMSFLNNFIHAIKLFSRKNPFSKIETDFSIAMISSLMQAFNGITITDYLEEIYENLDSIEKTDKFTIIHICSSHTLKSVLRKSRQYIKDKEHRVIAGKIVTNLIHSKTLAEAGEHFRAFAAIFAFKYKLLPFQKYYDEYAESKENSNVKEECDKADGKDSFKDDIENITLKKGKRRKDSPFYQYFDHLYDTMKEEADEFIKSKKTDELSENEYNSTAFFKYFLTYFIPYFPLWSSIVIKKFNLLRDSNASVENFFKIVKSYALDHEKLRVTQFTHTLQKMSYRWLAQRLHPQKTERQKRNRNRKRAELKKDTGVKGKNQSNIKKSKSKKRRSGKNRSDDMARESWMASKRRKTRKNNLFFPAEKHENNSNCNCAEKDARNDRMRENRRKRDEEEYKEFDESVDQLINEMSSVDRNDDLHWQNEIDPSQFCRSQESDDRTERKQYDVFSADIYERFFDQGLQYPAGFPHLTRTFAAISFNEELFERLMPTLALDGEILNGFLTALETVAASNGLKLLSFDTFFCEAMMDGKESRGFENWTKKVQPESYDIWLIPYNLNHCHWVLLAAIFPLKIMIYFDSMHGKPPEEFQKRIIQFVMSKSTEELQKTRKMTEWKLFIPSDIPQQYNIPGKNGDNCGVHALMWAYMIASGSDYVFTEAEMNQARKGIARFLNEFPESDVTRARAAKYEAMLNRDEGDKEDKEDKEKKKKKKKAIKFQMKKEAPYGSTVEFCGILKNLIAISRE